MWREEGKHQEEDWVWKFFVWGTGCSSPSFWLATSLFSFMLNWSVVWQESRSENVRKAGSTTCEEVRHLGGEISASPEIWFVWYTSNALYSIKASINSSVQRHLCINSSLYSSREIPHHCNRPQFPFLVTYLPFQIDAHRISFMDERIIACNDDVWHKSLYFALHACGGACTLYNIRRRSHASKDNPLCIIPRLIVRRFSWLNQSRHSRLSHYEGPELPRHWLGPSTRWRNGILSEEKRSASIRRRRQLWYRQTHDVCCDQAEREIFMSVLTKYVP